MKKYTILLLLISSITFSQKIIKNETDEFTGAKIKETSWIAFQRIKEPSYVQLYKVDSVFYLNLKVVTTQVVSVSKNASLMLKFNNGEILKLKNLEGTISSRGGGSTGLFYSALDGVSLTFSISREELEKIHSTVISKTRLYTSKGYIENNVKEKFYLKFKRLIELILRSN